MAAIGESVGEKIFKYSNVIILAIIGFIMIVPLLTVLATSFSSARMVELKEVLLWPKEFTFVSWQEILGKDDLWRSFLLNIFVTVFGTFTSLTFTTLLAYPASKKEFKLAKFVMIFVIITMIFKAPIIPYFLALRNMGLYNSVWVLIIPHAISAYNLAIMRTFFKQLPLELEEAAKMEGCGYFNLLFRIVIPLSKPVLATLGLFYAVVIWNQFFHPLLFISEPGLYPLQLKLKEFVDGEAVGLGNLVTKSYPYNKQTLKAATIIFATVPILFVYPFIQKYFVKGAMLGSVKG